MSFDIFRPAVEKDLPRLVEQEKKPTAPPHIASINAAVRYFKEKHKNKNEQHRLRICSDTYACSPWIAEPELMTDLMEARRKNNQPQADELRKYLRSVSWQEHKQFDTETLVKKIEHIKDELEHSQTAHNETEKPKIDIDSIVQALEQKKLGTKTETAVLAIEDLLMSTYKEYERSKKQYIDAYNRNENTTKKSEARLKIADRLAELRTIRDQLYFQALYKGWYELADSTPTN